MQLRIELQNNQLQDDPEINQKLIVDAARAQSVALFSVTDLVLAGRARHIRKGAFSGLPNLEVLSLPENRDLNLTTINFMNKEGDFVCESLRALIVSANTQRLHIDVAREDLNELTVLGEPRSLGDDIFANTRQFKQFYLPENCALVGLQQSDRPDAVAYHLQPMQIEQAGEVEIHDNLFVLSEDNDEERWRNDVVYWALPEGVVVVSSETDYRIERLRTLILPRSLMCIKSGTFTYYETLSYVSIHDNIESIETQAFIGCRDIEVYDSFSHLPPDRFEDYAFFDCNLPRFTVPSEAGPVLNPETIEAQAEALTIQTKLIDHLTIPAHITRIEGKISNTLPSLTKLTFAEDSRLEFIGERAFQGLSYLKFSSSLGVERLPASLYGIGAYAFADACGLDTSRRKLSLSTPISLGTRAFYQCDFARVYFSGTSPAILEDNVFESCRELEVVIFDGDVTLGANAFLGCYQLRDVVFYQNVEIADAAFKGCSKDLRLFFHGVEPLERYSEQEWRAKGIMHTGHLLSDEENSISDENSTVEDIEQLIPCDDDELPNLFRRMGLDQEQPRISRRHL